MEVDPILKSNLRALVERFHEVDAQLRELQERCKDLRRKRSEYSRQIMMVMETTGLEDVRFRDSMLRYSVRKVTLPPSKQVIRQRLEERFQGPDDGQLIQSILAPQSVQERPSIRRVRVR